MLIGCTNLTEITVDTNNTVYRSDGNCLIDIQNKSLIAGCKTSVIPDDGSVTSIAQYAFWGHRGLEEITVPKAVTEVGEYAFYMCTRLENITFLSKDIVLSDDDGTLHFNTAIHCYIDSNAYDYAVKYGRNRLAFGDVNGDEKVDSNDAIYLLRYTLLPDKYPINQNGNFNGDGVVDTEDAIGLLRYTLAPERYPIIIKQGG